MQHSTTDLLDFTQSQRSGFSSENQKINTKIDESLIKDLKKKGAEIETLENPQRGDFIKLWEIPCDILFFAGHSHTEGDGQIGKLYINKNDCLNLEELKRTLRAAIKNGLKIAIFNSCDGLGLPPGLILKVTLYPHTPESISKEAIANDSDVAIKLEFSELPGTEFFIEARLGDDVFSQECVMSN